MIHNIWDTFFYEPLYNALIFLIGVVPGGDVGIAVIVLTIIVKLLIYPLSQKSVVAQAKMRSLEGEIGTIKERHKGNKEEEARQTMALYRKHQVNPFSGCVSILIQLPIIIALYFVFLKGFDPASGVLYTFVHFPENFNTHFLGFFEVGKKSIILALFAGIVQYFQMALVVPKLKAKTDGKISFADEFSRSMNIQMKYMLPIFIVFVAYTTSGVIALYFAVSSIFAIGQELLVRRNSKILAV